MKNLFLAIFLLMPFYQNAQSEASTDRFIRIVGLAEKEINSQGMKIEFLLTEIEGNEYQKIRPKSIKEVRDAFVNGLSIIDIDPAMMEENNHKNITKSNYGKNDIEHYSIKVKDEDEAKKIAKMNIDGLKIGTINYIYPPVEEDFLNEMAIQAISDAKRKAGNIAQSVGKSIGDILNIEDMKNVDKNGSSSYKSAKTKILRYKINVTFELN